MLKLGVLWTGFWGRSQKASSADLFKAFFLLYRIIYSDTPIRIYSGPEFHFWEWIPFFGDSCERDLFYLRGGGSFFLYIFQKCFLLNENLDERHQTQQCRWAEDRYQSNLGFITPEQCHRLIVSMPRRIDAVTHAKGGPCNILVFRDTEFWVSVICKP